MACPPPPPPPPPAPGPIGGGDYSVIWGPFGGIIKPQAGPLPSVREAPRSTDTPLSLLQTAPLSTHAHLLFLTLHSNLRSTALRSPQAPPHTYVFATSGRGGKLSLTSSPKTLTPPAWLRELLSGSAPVHFLCLISWLAKRKKKKKKGGIPKKQPLFLSLFSRGREFFFRKAENASRLSHPPPPSPHPNCCTSTDPRPPFEAFLKKSSCGVPVHEFLAGGLRRVLRHHVLCVLRHGRRAALDHRPAPRAARGPVLRPGRRHPHPVHRAHQRRPHQPGCHLRLPGGLPDVPVPCRLLHGRPVPGRRGRGGRALRGHSQQHERQHGHEHGKGNTTSAVWGEEGRAGDRNVQ